MLTYKPFQFTGSNQASIPIYRRKWQKIACSTRPLDRQEVSLAINQAYEFMGISHPNIIFITAPEDVLNYIYQEVTASWGKLDRTSLGNAISTQLVHKLLGNIRNSESELIIKRLEMNLDEGLAKSKAEIIASEIEPSLATSLFFANTTSFMDSTFEAEPPLPGIPKIVIKSFLDILSSGAFIQSQYLASFQWQIFSQFATFIAQDKSQEMYDAFKELGADIVAGRVNRKQGGEYQLPTIEFSTAFVNVFIPSVMIDYAYYIDYCQEILDFDCNYLKWSIFSDLITSCGWFFPYEKTVFICDR